ncbi:OmpH family outer membrane protein [Salinimicrobium flavum]|uniref:OmpH family outer membrane protein n=1 Tax=Salinimicrobium flavum TaxID=1737065 RepID=A0ABW5IYX7_9FLAO
MKKILAVILLGSFLVGCNDQKTAYVDTTKLIQEYSEMKEVEASFTQKSEKMKAELDSVATGFQNEVREYQENMATMSQAERQAAEQELRQKQQMLQQQQQMRSGLLRQESDVVIDSLVTKVKDFVKAYGEEHDYTYIFGSNESANIMYAKEGLDITEEILEELNSGKTSVETEE